jgi:hypothetical protein
VPDVRGKTLEEATKALADVGLTVAPGPQPVETDDQTLVGKVADQNPPAGQSVQAGSPVTLSIGKGPDTVTVPDLTRQKFDTAKANLEGLGFQVQREDVSSNEPEGTVVDQSPKGGWVRPATTRRSGCPTWSASDSTRPRACCVRVAGPASSIPSTTRRTTRGRSAGSPSRSFRPVPRSTRTTR